MAPSYKAEGRVEGAMNEKIETAKRMKAKNIPSDTIAQWTGLATEEIELLYFWLQF